MTKLLRTFPIIARTVWPEPRLADSKSFHGYKREWFEPYWAQYCDQDDNTATQSRKVKHLRVVRD